MRTKRSITGMTVVAGTLLWAGWASADCGKDHANHDTSATSGVAKETKTMQTSVAQKNIVETAIAAGSFDTLVAAVRAGGLADVLSGEGPFTVFAPTDAAFAKLPKGTLESLLLPENKAKLATILTYHVVPGRVMAADVVKLQKAKTVQGQEVQIRVRDGKVMIDGAQVVTTDITTTNGVIHVIDTVITPPAI